MSTANHSHHPHHAALINPDGSWQYTNKLIDATSPYLRQHAHNPVDWYPWSEQAFSEAVRRDVPIFLSIGYSTCYWCHVMERQVFEHPQIAAKMNELFVNIKVDREERPDLDDIYMAATQIMTRRGGWPMSVFLTPPAAADADDPGLKPFWCGTYIPPTASHGMASFPQVLDALSRAYREDRAEIVEQAEKVTGYIEYQLAAAAEPTPPDARLVHATANAIAQTYDTDHGGFGNAPKFPQASSLRFLLAVEQSQGNQALWMMLEHTLDRMARGGMYDQISGGFHRYSVDEQWLVPHFEKMLYDNGQLAELYVHATEVHPQSPRAEDFKRVAIEICEYVLREMRDPIGAFWSAQDAEVNAMEGGNYVWTQEEVDAAIDSEQLSELACKLYGLDRGTNFQDPHIENAPHVNVLYLPKTLQALADELGIDREQLMQNCEEIKQALLKVRDQRDQPATDDKVLTSWNGMMIAGLAAVGRVCDRMDFIEAAIAASDAIDKHLQLQDDKDAALARSYRDGVASIPAFLDDYANLIHARLELHKASRDPWHLDRAIALTDHVSQHFAHPRGGYFDTDRPRLDVIVRTRTHYDGATASGNSQMAHNLLDLYHATGDADYLQRAANIIHALGQTLAQESVGMPHLLHAMLRLQQVSPDLLTLKDAETQTRPTDNPVTILPPTCPIRFENNRARFTLTLKIGEGYHLLAETSNDAASHASPAQLAVSTAPPAAAQIRWPDPIDRTYRFADEPLSVYQGRIEISIDLHLADQAHAADTPRQVNIDLTYQACSESACEPANTISLTLPIQPE